VRAAVGRRRRRTACLEPLVGDQAQLLERHGYRIAQRIDVATPSLRFGANHGARGDHEVILIGARDSVAGIEAKEPIQVPARKLRGNP
jgi:hypothetical protein